MKYVHPDVLDNGIQYVRNNATRILLLPTFSGGVTYAQALADALVSIAATAADFTISVEGAGRKVVYGGSGQSAALKSAPSASDLHIAYTDGISRILWVDEETSRIPILSGQMYRLPSQTLIVQLA